MSSFNRDDQIGLTEEEVEEGRALFEAAREHLEACNALVDELFPESTRKPARTVDTQQRWRSVKGTQGDRDAT